MRWPWKNKTEPETADEAPFVADAPIVTSVEDKLGRTEFAKTLAELITRWRGDTSLVIALRSPWGNGKTSVKNLVLEQLKIGKSKARALQFNPWQYDSSQAITAAFYRELRFSLGDRSGGIEAWKRQRALRKYGRYFTATSSGLTAAGSQVTPILTAMTLLGLSAFSASFLTQPSMLRWGGFIVAILGSLGLLGKLFLFLGMPKEDAPQHHARAELEELLRKLKGPLLVIIDDLDRLDQEAIRLVIRHVKVNADLPNITYLLLFQREIVEAALDGISDGQGRDYLDKIVLAPFDLPPVEHERLSKVLFAALDALLEKLPEDTGFDSGRWGNAYHGGLKYYFRNLRDVHRFVASLAVQMTLHVGKKMVEVNIIDVFILETLRLFEPDLYTLIANNKALLTGSKLDDGGRDRVRALITKAKNEEAAQALLTELFPKASAAFPGGMSYSDGFFGEWASSRRVAVDRVFDRYFSLRVPDNTLTASEFAEILENAGDRVFLDAALDDLKARGLLDALMSRLDEMREQLPIEHIEVLAGAMFDIGDELQDGAFFFGSMPYVACWRAASWYFHGIVDPEERSKRFIATLEGAHGVSVPATIIGLDDERVAKDEGGRLTLTDSDRPKAKAIWFEKLQLLLADPAAFLALPRALSDLYSARRFGFEVEVREWASQTIDTPAFLMPFLKAFVSTSHSFGMSDHVAQSNHSLSVKYLTDFVELETLSARLSALDPSTLSSEDRALIVEFEKKRSQPLGQEEDDDH